MKRPTKRLRFLPEHVSKFTDRHGRLRYRYRRAGFSHYFKAPFGTEEFRAEWAQCEAGTVETNAKPRVAPGTLEDLVQRYFAVPSRLGPTEATQARIRGIIDRVREKHGHRFVADVEFEHVEAIVDAKKAKAVVGGRIVDGQLVGGRTEGGMDAARKLRKELIRLFDYAEKIRMRPAGSNPARMSERVKIAANKKSKGYHTWTEEEIAQYRTSHALGTRARLAMELMLWTGQRRSDARLFGPDDVLDGRHGFTQGKTGKGLGIAIAPQLLEAITSMPPPKPDQKTYLVTERGKPFSKAGFGNKMREWCDEAGLPQCTAHGLRKAIMRRMAELGMGNQALKSVSGHSKDDEVALYTAEADQMRMADAAISALAAWEKGRKPE